MQLGIHTQALPQNKFHFNRNLNVCANNSFKELYLLHFINTKIQKHVSFFLQITHVLIGLCQFFASIFRSHVAETLSRIRNMLVRVCMQSKTVGKALKITLNHN